MHSVLISRLFCVTTALKKRQYERSFLQYPTILLRSYRAAHSAKNSSIMAAECFKGTNDCYNGVIINSNDEPCDSETFVRRFDASLQQWTKENRRTIWFKVYIPQAEWVPLLTKRGFKFHHAQDQYVMLYSWLIANQECNLPPYAHTNLGVGAFVYNEETDEVLVIKEKCSPISITWKLPGGYVEPREDLDVAVRREVSEETGIETTFKCFVAFRHAHGYSFGCSDIYMVAYLSPRNLNIQKCQREISQCKWMKLDEFVQHPEVHEFNRELARKLMEFFKHRAGMTLEHKTHPTTKKPMCIYTISQINIERSSDR